MRQTSVLCLRRFLNSPYDVFKHIKSPDRWLCKERVFRFTAWQMNDWRDKYRYSIRKVFKIWQHETIKRQNEPKWFKHTAQERVKAALEQYKMDYPVFKTLLSQAHIELSDQSLMHLATTEPRSFKALALLTKQMALDRGSQKIRANPLPENVIVNADSILSEPLPRRKVRRRGPAQDFYDYPPLIPRSRY